MPVHRRVTPSIEFAGTHLYTWVERGTVRVKCFAQEHNTMSPARPRTRTTRSGVERTNHEATAPPRITLYYTVFKLLLKFTLVLCELSELHLVLHIICPAFNVCPLYEWAVRAKTLLCKIFALLLTFALVSCELCEPYFVLYIIRRSKLFAPLCGPRGL